MSAAQQRNWAVILGGSSGFGLATAKKLAQDGLNLVIVHRDRRGAMAAIDAAFDEIREDGTQVHSFNINALSEEGRTQVLDDLPAILEGGKVRVLLHSIALGNLKLLAPQHPLKAEHKQNTLKGLAAHLGISSDQLNAAINKTFAEGGDELVELADSAEFNDDLLLGEEDFTATVNNMGTNLCAWVRGVFERGLFGSDARVFGLTSEGNEIAWRGYAAVSAAKTALEAVSRAIAVEYAPYGIRCNIIQPGVTDTKALRLIPGCQRLIANARQRNPFGRLTRPEDVAGLIALLSRDEAGWVNGSLIRVDGGEHVSG